MAEAVVISLDGSPGRWPEIRVTHPCGHTILHRLSGPLAPNTPEEFGTEDCPECWYKKTFPKFTIALGNRSLYVEGAFEISELLRSRGYRKGGEESPWSKQLKSKATYRKELAWIRGKGFNVWGRERRKDGHVYALDLRGGVSCEKG